MGGARWVPNWYFEDKLKTAGTPLAARAFPGGASGVASFAYAPFSNFEFAIDLFVSNDQFEVTGDAKYTSILYGGLVVGKYTARNVLFQGFNPFLGIGGGPALGWLGKDGQLLDEKLTIATAVMGGFQIQFTNNLGITVDVRYMLARRWFPDVSGMNIGGVSAHVGFTYFFPIAPKSEFGSSF
jgi:hypothetical protein